MKYKVDKHELLKPFKRHIEALKKVEGCCTTDWSSKNTDRAKSMILGNSKPPTLNITPLSGTHWGWGSSRPDLFVIRVNPQVNIITRHWQKYGEVVDAIVAVTKGDELTLVDTSHMWNDQIAALCAIIGGNVWERRSVYPLTYKRWGYMQKTPTGNNWVEAPFMPGTKFKVTNGNQAQVVGKPVDFKIRSKGKVTRRVNELVKAHYFNAEALSKLIINDSASFAERCETLNKIGKQHFGQRINGNWMLTSNNMYATPHALVSNNTNTMKFSDEGVILPPKNFSIAETLYEAIQEENYAPMAYLLAEFKDTFYGQNDLLNKIKVAMRVIEGGYYMDAE